MSVLGSWGVSGPRFDTIQDWTSLANVKPQRKKIRRSASSGYLPNPLSPDGLSHSSSTASLLSRTTSSANLTSPSRLTGHQLTSPQSATMGTGRIPTFAFASNPYQVSRANLTGSIAQTLSTGGLGSPSSLQNQPPLSPPHQFAIHQLPRSNSTGGTSMRRRTTGGTPSTIPIPHGSPLPLTPGQVRSSLVQQQQQLMAQQMAQTRNLAQEFSATVNLNGTQSQSTASNTTYNPYLLTDSPTASPNGASATLMQGNQLFRRTKNLEQRLAEYLNPTRSSTSPNKQQQVAESPNKNINVNLIPHPKNPLASILSPVSVSGGIVTSPSPSPTIDVNSSPSNSGQEEKEQSINVLHDSNGGKKSREHSPAHGGKKKKGGKHVTHEDEEHEDDDGAHGHSSAPASMNLRAVLRAQKQQEADAAAAAAAEKEAKKPWAGLSWNEIVQARTFLLHQAKNKDKATAPIGMGAGPSTAALQVAQQLLNNSRKNSESGGPKKPLNIYSLTEFQRNEYKTATEQAKWLNFFAKEDMVAYANAHQSHGPAPTASKTVAEQQNKAVKEPEMIPNDQKRVSSKTRMMNMAKGDVQSQTNAQAGGSDGEGKNKGTGTLLYNTYASCNSQYGYVRYVGRAPWGNGSWVGLELVEKHPYAAFGAWVDFYYEHSAISMQMVEESPMSPSNAKSGIPGGRQRGGSIMSPSSASASSAPQATSAADQMSPNGPGGAAGGPQMQMMVNTALARPLVLAAMMPPTRESKTAVKIMSEKTDKALGLSNDQFQPLTASIFPFIDVMTFIREGLVNCFDMQDCDLGTIYFAPAESVRRVATKAKIDSKTLLQHKENQTNPFQEVDELACATPKKHEGNIEMLARYLTVSDREILDGDRNKARSIFRWICHNIRYDPHSTAPKNDVISIIRHRKATGEGFALLFHALATAGGLQCLRIRGVEKQLNQKTDQVIRNKHAWNAIKIEGEWSFVDCVFSCGQYVHADPAASPSSSSKAVVNPASSSTAGHFQQMFSDAYFCTPPSLFILEHFPTDAFGDSFSKVLPSEYNNLQLLRSIVSASEFEKGLIPGRAFVEYHMRAAPFTYAVECKQPSYQIEITAPSFILFDVDLRIKSASVDLSQCSHIQYDGEQVTIYLIFPVPGEYICKITCKPSWRELDVYDNCLTYRMTSHTGLVPLSSNKDVIIGFLQHRKVNARDSRSLFNRHFTLLHPLSGHLIPKAPFIVQVKGPDIADSVVVACNGDWQRLTASTLAKSGVKMFEGTAIIQPRYELQIFYEMDKKFHLLFNYKANLTSFTNVYLDKTKEKELAEKSNMALTQDLWHGKCALGIEGRVFDANLSLDVPNCRFGKQVCSFLIHCSIAWDIALQVQEGWKNGTPLPESQVVVEEQKSFRTNLMTQYKITTTLPATAALEVKPASSPTAEKMKTAAALDALASSPTTSAKSASLALEFVSHLSDGQQRRAAEEAERRRAAANKIPFSSGPEVDEAPKASTQFVLVINARNIKQGGPMRYCLSYYFDVAKSGSQAATTNQNLQIEVVD